MAQIDRLMTLKQSDGEATVMRKALGNVEYPLIAIAVRFHSGSEW